MDGPRPPFFSTSFAQVCENELNLEVVMAALWLLLLPVAGLVWYVVADAVRAVPKCNEDFTFY